MKQKLKELQEIRLQEYLFTLRPSETKVDTTTTTNGYKTPYGHIKGNKTNTCFISYNTSIQNQNIITSLPISHPNTLSPIPTKSTNLCYPSKLHKQLTSPSQNKIKILTLECEEHYF